MNISTQYWSRHCHSYSLSQTSHLPLTVSPSFALSLSNSNSSHVFPSSLTPSLAQVVSRSYGAPGYNQITATEMECIRNWHAVQCMCVYEHASSTQCPHQNRKILKGLVSGQAWVKGFRIFFLFNSLCCDLFVLHFIEIMSVKHFDNCCHQLITSYATQKFHREDLPNLPG